MTAGCKPTIRSTRKEAREARLRQLETNRIPIAEGDADEDAWVGTPGDIAERMVERRAIGFDTFIAEMLAPHDLETLERWIGEVAPQVDR
jgi:alkanesulfonate monooxygenase SsuD/methylene tetrahydromethanopterin reductase-like flavin-dependent oxidoreductase (luciferase family)